MDVPKFQSLARSAMNEREMRSLSGGNVCGCACRSNSTMDNGSANHAGYFLDEVVVTASHAATEEPNFEVCE